MDNITIQSDKGEINLRKSQSLVGLKMLPTRGLGDPSFISKEIHQSLGGFKLVKLDTSEKNINDKLDEVRDQDDVEVGTHVYYPENSNRPLIATGEIFITFEEGTSEEEQNIALDEFKLELEERRGPYFIVAKVTSESPNPIKAAHFLQESCLVRLAEPDFDTILDHYEDGLPTDTLLAHEWHLQNNGFVPDSNVQLRRGIDVKAISAWRRLGNMGSSNIVLAVIDNGFDLAHPDLKSKVFRPFDLWNNSPQVLQGDPRYTHGTPCASVAIAASNGVGMVGSAPNAKFMPVSGTSFASRATELMFDYCIANGADVISCSWGTVDPAYQLNSIKQQAISRAARQGRNGLGCVVLFAAGNDFKNYINFYAAHPDVIAVGACNSQGVFANYSNQGMEVTLCAPSNGDWPILAARAWWDQGDPDPKLQGEFKYWVDGVSRGNQYKHFGGTSSATPLVAGVCALILSANPNLTAAEVKQILIQTADKIGNPADYLNGQSRKYGAGMINADRAVAEAIRRRTLTGGFNAGGQPIPPVNPQPQPIPQPIPQPRPVNATAFPNVPAVPNSGWGVQIGVYSNADNVLNLVNKLRQQFAQPVFVSNLLSNGQTVYRVVVGNYATMNEAQIMQSRLSQAGFGGLLKNLGEMV
jgi:cell division septation protein DedD